MLAGSAGLCEDWDLPECHAAEYSRLQGQGGSVEYGPVGGSVGYGPVGGSVGCGPVCG